MLLVCNLDQITKKMRAKKTRLASIFWKSTMAWATLRWNFVNTAAIAAFCALPLFGVKSQGPSKLQFTIATVQTELHQSSSAGRCGIS
jgi:hypothetical protein